ncbi:MAG: 2-dehydropantoate 2-reductase [Steroidobacteraceae bacterium]
MRIVILGAGAMGKLFGTRLALNGQSVVMVDVDADTLQQISREGLRLTADDGDHQVQVQAARAADLQPGADAVVVFTKAQHTVAAMQSIAHAIGPGTCVLTLQNGLGGAERILSVLPGADVAVGTTTWPADAKAPNHVSTHGAGEIRFWSHDGVERDSLQRLNTVLAAAGLASRLDPAVQVVIWEKVIFNSVMNPVAALTRCTVGEMADSAECMPLTESILQEAFAIARKAQVPVDEARVRKTLAHARENHRPHKPSMLSDVLAGRTTEIDAINGALAERAAALGVAAPVMQTISRLVRMIRKENLSR